MIAGSTSSAPGRPTSFSPFSHSSRSQPWEAKSPIDRATCRRSSSAPPPQQVWRAITESEFTLRYYYGSTVESDWSAGAAYRYAIDGNDAILGVILEADPPRRLVQTFDARWDDDVAGDAPSRMTWEIEELMPGVSKVTIIHDEFPSRTATFESVSGGTNFILSGLKTVLETGRSLQTTAAAATA